MNHLNALRYAQGEYARLGVPFPAHYAARVRANTPGDIGTMEACILIRDLEEVGAEVPAALRDMVYAARPNPIHLTPMVPRSAEEVRLLIRERQKNGASADYHLLTLLRKFEASEAEQARRAAEDAQRTERQAALPAPPGPIDQWCRDNYVVVTVFFAILFFYGCK